MHSGKTLDHDIFASLFQEHEQRIYNLGLRYLGNHHDALDLVQDVFLRVYRYAGDFRGDAEFSTWVYRIALNSCYDELRSRKRRPSLTESAMEGEEPAFFSDRAEPESPDDLLLRQEVYQAVWGALARISPEARELLVLHHLRGRSCKDLAPILGCPEGTVKSRLFRARKELHRALRADRRSWEGAA